jgi:hypothetical protein
MDIQEYLEDKSRKQQVLIAYFHALAMDVPGMELKRRFGLPFYFRKSWICYVNVLHNGNVEFAFPRGNELKVQGNILNDRGRKQVRSLDFSDFQELDQDLIRALLMEAVALDEEVPYRLKRKA